MCYRGAGVCDRESGPGCLWTRNSLFQSVMGSDKVTLLLMLQLHFADKNIYLRLLLFLCVEQQLPSCRVLPLITWRSAYSPDHKPLHRWTVPLDLQEHWLWVKFTSSWSMLRRKAWRELFEQDWLFTGELSVQTGESRGCWHFPGTCCCEDICFQQRVTLNKAGLKNMLFKRHISLLLLTPACLHCSLSALSTQLTAGPSAPVSANREEHTPLPFYNTELRPIYLSFCPSVHHLPSSSSWSLSISHVITPACWTTQFKPQRLDLRMTLNIPLEYNILI